jgi:hypothetical protein
VSLGKCARDKTLTTQGVDGRAGRASRAVDTKGRDVERSWCSYFLTLSLDILTVRRRCKNRGNKDGCKRSKELHVWTARIGMRRMCRGGAMRVENAGDKRAWSLYQRLHVQLKARRKSHNADQQPGTGVKEFSSRDVA